MSGFANWWVRRIRVFQPHSTRNPDELTGNITMERGLDHFTEGLVRRFPQHGKSPEAGKAAGFHLPSQQTGGVSPGGRGHSGCRPHLFRLPSLPGGDGCLDPHQRHRLIGRGYGLRLPFNGVCLTQDVGENHRRIRSSCSRGPRQAPGRGLETDERGYPVHRLWPPDQDGHLESEEEMGRKPAGTEKITVPCTSDGVIAASRRKLKLPFSLEEFPPCV